MHRSDQQGPTDRREQLRREEDDERATIAVHAVHDAPLVRRLLRTLRVSSATFLFGGVLGGGGVAVGNKALASRVEKNEARIETIETVLSDMRRDIATVSHNIEIVTYVQCVELRRTNPDLRPPGCDAAVLRSAR